jgi:hypothetical protein
MYKACTIRSGIILRNYYGFDWKENWKMVDLPKLKDLNEIDGKVSRFY